MRNTLIYILISIFTTSVAAKTCFVAVNGSDTNNGSKEAPFASLKKAESLVNTGDTVYIRGGTYQLTESQIMDNSSSTLWAYVFRAGKKGVSYLGYPGERPIFDLSKVKPSGKRVIVFYVTGSNLHFRNFEIVGTQVTIVGHTQSECFRIDGGNYNIFENIAMHDGMAIGFYLVRGMQNLVLNCDAYNNYDYISDGGRGGNVDGFGGHANTTSSTGNIFRGCRAWYNSDDGFDLINCHSAITIDSCWSFLNGYKPGTFESAGDGSGFKSGGFGMSADPKVPAIIPVHVVKNSLAYYNKNKGFYSNHHLGGIIWYNNTGYRNPSNFCMLNRKSAAEIADVPGYGHIIKNNLSYSPRTSGQHIVDVNQSLCTIVSNSFLPVAISLSDTDFESVDHTQLTRARKNDGSLPEISFLRPSKNSRIIDKGVNIGQQFSGFNPDLGCFEYKDNSTDIELGKINNTTIWSERNMLYIHSKIESRYKIFDETGKIVKNIPNNNGLISLNLKKGFYLVCDSENTITKAVISF